MQSRFQTRRRKLRSSQIFPRKHSVVLANIDPVPEETRSGILPTYLPVDVLELFTWLEQSCPWQWFAGATS